MRERKIILIFEIYIDFSKLKFNKMSEFFSIPFQVYCAELA